MLLRTVLRLSSATRVLPFLVGFIAFALGGDMTEWATPHYWLSVTGSATNALGFAGAACAGAAAWEGGRLRRAQIFDLTAVRSPLAIALPLLLPVFAMGVAGMGAALAVTAAAADVGLGVPHLGILAVEAVLLAANTLVGYLLGRLLAPVLAVPVALIISFVAIAFPVSWDILWARHLVGGGLIDCCDVDQSLDVRALVSAGVFGTAVCLAALVLIHYRKTVPALVTAMALTAGGFAGGAAAARGMGADPVVSRPTSELVCDDGQPRICLWPETDGQAAMIRTEARKAADRLRQVGVTVPATLTMADRPGADESKLAIGADTDADDVRIGVVAGLVPQAPACAEEGEPYPAEIASGPVGAWLSLTAGASPRVVANRVIPPELALAQHVLKQPRHAQLDWYKRNAKAMGVCNVRPQLRIGGSQS
ncbi:hypothetical protein [Streptomyces sp. XD-27]|uniref:DUF7224 domain-containing protein n=1 Tax=Streptomyces sp. XD-27 TaxID=3062779 RepID=UPI0026F40CCF|nr:hypothetical protein [Streptomyces sp. XD-27]WKX72287.1 hypothetical protein Q3Y56_22425 [Streptomyces sp. XD-27]